MKSHSLYEALGTGALKEVTYLLFWECGHCGNLAGFYDGHCSSCNHPFDGQELGKISDSDFKVVMDEGLKYKLTQMIGWYCSHCDSYNRNLKRSDYESGTYKQPNFHLNCERQCGNELDESDGDYILRDGPSASSPTQAVKNLIRHNQKIRERIRSERVGRIISNDIPPLKSRQVTYVGKIQRSKVMNTLEKKYPKWYWGIGGGVALLSSFLIYKGFENFETTITIKGKDWERSLYIESVQQVEESGWGEDVDVSSHRTDPFHNYEEISRNYSNTGREDVNHNAQYCRLIPDSEPEIQGYSCRPVTTRSCTGTSGSGVTCTNITTPVCDVPIWGTRHFAREQCQRVRYTIHDWRFDRNITAPLPTSESLNPFWPEFTPKGDGIELGSEREVETRREEEYNIHVSYQNGERNDTLSIPLEVWETLYSGLQCPAEADFLSGIDVDTIDWNNCGNIMELGIIHPYFNVLKNIIGSH